MIKINIDTYSDIYKQDVAHLIIDIQKNEFDIPINLEEQPDLKEIPNVYQINNGNFWIATVGKSCYWSNRITKYWRWSGRIKKNVCKRKNIEAKNLALDKGC
jgi:hypothetical protein